MNSDEVAKVRMLMEEMMEVFNTATARSIDTPTEDVVEQQAECSGGKVEWSTMRKFPRGVIRAGMQGSCNGIDFVLDDNLNFQVYSGEHRGRPFTSPSELAKVAHGAVRNGFDYVSLEGHKLNYWRTKWDGAED